MRLLSALLLSLLLCACPADPAPSDQTLYLAAVSAGDPAACAPIAAPALRGECTAQGARELADAGEVDAAWSTCGGMDSGPWRDECHFLVADALHLTGDEAKQACQTTGQFRQQCLGHAIARDAASLFSTQVLGEEDQLLVAVEGVVRRYIRGGEATQKARRILAKELANRDPEGPFTASTCGSAPREVCVDAYKERVKRAAHLVNDGEDDGSWRIGCGRVAVRERVAAAGLPDWEPEVEAVVQEAWRELCAR